MIKSINRNLDMSQNIDLSMFEEKLMEELENKDEFVCYGTYCKQDYQS